MKKRLLIFIFGIFFLAFMSSFVSADVIDDMAGGLSSFISGIFEVLKGPLEIAVGESASGEWFLAKVLFLIIIFSLSWVTLKSISFFKGHNWALWMVSIAVSILSINGFSNSEIVQSVLLPYSTFGIALTAGLPFILFLFIVKDHSPPIRKVSWIAFAVIFIGLWFSRMEDVGTAVIAYPITAGAAFVMFFMDGTIARWNKQIKAEANKKIAETRRAAKVARERLQLEEDLDRLYGGDVNDKRYKALDEHISKLEKRYNV